MYRFWPHFLKLIVFETQRLCLILFVRGTGESALRGMCPSESGKFCKYKIEMGQFGAMFLPLFSYIVGFEIEAYVNFYF